MGPLSASAAKKKEEKTVKKKKERVKKGKLKKGRSRKALDDPISNEELSALGYDVFESTDTISPLKTYHNPANVITKAKRSARASIFRQPETGDGKLYYE